MQRVPSFGPQFPFLPVSSYGFRRVSPVSLASGGHLKASNRRVLGIHQLLLQAGRQLHLGEGACPIPEDACDLGSWLSRQRVDIDVNSEVH